LATSQVCYSGQKQCTKSWGEQQNSSFAQQHITQDTALPFHGPRRGKETKGGRGKEMGNMNIPHSKGSVSSN